jgi:SpoVK/Ycf46/Vps4 family AAA+-type ATPase
MTLPATVTPYNSDVDPSYNDFVVMESGELTTAFEQYWQNRKAACAENLARLRPLAANTDGERRWQAFCLDHTGFLDKFLKTAVKAAGDPLRDAWKGNLGLARDAQRSLQTELTMELWIPYQKFPLKFVCTSTRDKGYRLRESSLPTTPKHFELGKAYVTVFLGESCLFTLVPSGNYVTLNTFEFEKDGLVWNSGDLLPKIFAQTLEGFHSELRNAERSFAPLSASWNAKAELDRETADLDRIDRNAHAWSTVHLPLEQKLEILRRMELFEKGDPAAPRGLLLHGPTGTGKSLIARTLAETIGCYFQSLSLADIKDEHLGASGRLVREKWEHARANRPSIIFVDECDGVFGRRGAAETDVIAADVVRSFLPEWDGIEQTPGIMVIGATNKRATLDDAIISRFGWEMEISLPGAPERRNILEQELRANRIQIELSPDTSSLTQGMSGRDIRNLAATTKSLAHPNAPTAAHLIQAAGAARKRENALVGRAETWDSLALEPADLDRLMLICALLRDAEKWHAQGITVPGSLLLTGPDGGMKRQLAQTLANETGLTFLAPTLSDFKANFSGQSGNSVKLFFERALASSPAIVFLDRLDMIAPSRNVANATDALSNEIIAQLAQEWERAAYSEGHIFLLGATSNPDQVDQEVLDCFQERMAVALPNRNARIKLFARLLTDKKIAFSLDDGALLLAELSEGKSLDSRDIDNWVQAAQQRALLRAVKNGGPEHYSITLDDFEPLQLA